MSRLPSVFMEDGQPAAVNPSLQFTSMLDLPQRMEGNRLHRFSKVLDTSSIGREHISTKILPKCPILDISIAEPLNRTGNYFTSLGQLFLSFIADLRYYLLLSLTYHLLNFFSAPSNLYKSQKLLLLDNSVSQMDLPMSNLMAVNKQDKVNKFYYYLRIKHFYKNNFFFIRIFILVLSTIG